MYAPALPSLLVNGNVSERESARIRLRRVYVRRHRSWSNFWTMSVTDGPTGVGARGRLPGI